MSEPAIGEDAGADRELTRMRAAGWTWKHFRGGIVCKTPKNTDGDHATSIWYGAHVVEWEMIRTRPRPPKVQGAPDAK